MQITTFKPEKFWSLNPYIIKDGYELRLEWDRNKVFDYDVRFFSDSCFNYLLAVLPFFILMKTLVFSFELQVAMMFQKLVSDDHTLKVTDILTKKECKSRPCGLNTVNMLKVTAIT